MLNAGLYECVGLWFTGSEGCGEHLKTIGEVFQALWPSSESDTDDTETQVQGQVQGLCNAARISIELITISEANPDVQQAPACFAPCERTNENKDAIRKFEPSVKTRAVRLVNFVTDGSDNFGLVVEANNQRFAECAVFSYEINAIQPTNIISNAVPVTVNDVLRQFNRAKVPTPADGACGYAAVKGGWPTTSRELKMLTAPRWFLKVVGSGMQRVVSDGGEITQWLVDTIRGVTEATIDGISSDAGVLQDFVEAATARWSKAAAELETNGSISQAFWLNAVPDLAFAAAVLSRIHANGRLLVVQRWTGATVKEVSIQIWSTAALTRRIIVGGDDLAALKSGAQDGLAGMPVGNESAVLVFDGDAHFSVTVSTASPVEPMHVDDDASVCFNCANEITTYIAGTDKSTCKPFGHCAALTYLTLACRPGQEGGKPLAVVWKRRRATSHEPIHVSDGVFVNEPAKRSMRMLGVKLRTVYSGQLLRSEDGEAIVVLAVSAPTASESKSRVQGRKSTETFFVFGLRITMDGLNVDDDDALVAAIGSLDQPTRFRLPLLQPREEEPTRLWTAAAAKAAQKGAAFMMTVGMSEADATRKCAEINCPVERATDGGAKSRASPSPGPRSSSRLRIKPVNLYMSSLGDEQAIKDQKAQTIKDQRQAAKIAKTARALERKSAAESPSTTRASTTRAQPKKVSAKPKTKGTQAQPKRRYSIEESEDPWQTEDSNSNIESDDEAVSDAEHDARAALSATMATKKLKKAKFVEQPHDDRHAALAAELHMVKAQLSQLHAVQAAQSQPVHPPSQQADLPARPPAAAAFPSAQPRHTQLKHFERQEVVPVHTTVSRQDEQARKLASMKVIEADINGKRVYEATMTRADRLEQMGQPAAAQCMRKRAAQTHLQQAKEETAQAEEDEMMALLN